MFVDGDGGEALDALESSTDGPLAYPGLVRHNQQRKFGPLLPFHMETRIVVINFFYSLALKCDSASLIHLSCPLDSTRSQATNLFVELR